MQVGEVIRKYRKARNMTQEEMAGLDKKEKTDNLYKLSNYYSDGKGIILLGVCANCTKKLK